MQAVARLTSKAIQQISQLPLPICAIMLLNASLSPDFLLMQSLKLDPDRGYAANTTIIFTRSEHQRRRGTSTTNYVGSRGDIVTFGEIQGSPALLKCPITMQSLAKCHLKQAEGLF